MCHALQDEKEKKSLGEVIQPVSVRREACSFENFSVSSYVRAVYINQLRLFGEPSRRGVLRENELT